MNEKVTFTIDEFFEYIGELANEKRKLNKTIEHKDKEIQFLFKKLKDNKLDNFPYYKELNEFIDGNKEIK